MGFQVENYSLNELHRIALPGTVAPLLFWALPVGDWDLRELDEVWRWFTKHQSECNDLGLLLVRGTGHRKNEATDVSLASVGAKLSEVMPSGADRFVSPSDYQGNLSQILVLSGGYPQPGWGVLIEWRRGDIHRFEGLIRQTILHLRSDDSRNDLNVFIEAAETFHHLQNFRDEPDRPNVSVIEGEILVAEKIDNFLHEAQAALETGNYRLVGSRLNAAMQEARHTTRLSNLENSLQPLLSTQRTLEAAASIAAISSDALKTEIEPKLSVMLADPNKRDGIFREQTSSEVKLALKECFYLRSKGILEEGEKFQTWASKTLATDGMALGPSIAKVRADIEVILIKHRGEKAHLERKHDDAMRKWRPNAMKARENFHVAAGKAVELQWKLGPEFLVAFEQICRQQGVSVRSIPWDPARMVGWKLMVSQAKIYFQDLQIAAKEFAPGAMGLNPTNGTRAALADGSYFTDYVHYIAISKPGFSPRSVTRNLVARLLLPSKMNELIEIHGGQPSAGADAPHLAEELLHTFGWRQSDDGREKPLAGCIKSLDDGTPVIAENLKENDIRIVLESFCKDVVDVIVAQLGYGHSQLWSVIKERIPGYRPSSRERNWEEEVRLMTVGAAGIILPALGPLAFPERAHEIGEFATILQALSGLLNQMSHHRQSESISQEARGKIPSLIHQLLGKAETLLGELPWHLEASFVYGEQPKVLSGEAWSHGSPTPRLLRVIVWTGKSPGSRVTFWNKERRNPVVPDPVFIVRPCRR